MNIFTKKLSVPESVETKNIEVAQLWEVRWMARTGQSGNDVKPQVEVFISEKEANDFKKALENAYALLRYKIGYRLYDTNEGKVFLEKAK